AEGYLRARRAGQLTREDVVVEISPEIQSALVEQAEGSAVDIMVVLISASGAGAFDPQRSYVALESSGVRVDDLRVEVIDQKSLRIRGTKHTEPVFRTDFEAVNQRFDDFDQELDEREREMKRHGAP